MSSVKLREWLKISPTLLGAAGVDSARLDSMLLLEHVLGKTREWILAHDEITLTTQQVRRLNTLRTRREAREPLAYIVGSKEFYDRTFLVSESVLIPRPESEAMIDLLIRVAAKPTNLSAIIDVGTGSGCLAITAKSELPHMHVSACDISEDALQIAKRNAGQLHAHVQFFSSDLLTSLPSMPSSQSYIILANLPYVPEGVITSTEITKEPALALFSGTDGLDLYRTFWKQVKGLKNKPQAIVTESLQKQHGDMTRVANTSGYKLVESKTLAQHFCLA